MVNIVSKISTEDFLNAINILVQLRLIDLSYQSDDLELENILSKFDDSYIFYLIKKGYINKNII